MYKIFERIKRFIYLLITLTLSQSTMADVFFSEYVEGSANDSALEVYNASDAPIDLSTYVIELYSDGSSTLSATLTLSQSGLTMLASGETFVLANPDANTDILNQSDYTHATAVFNGNDAILLKHNGVIIDAIGEVGINPGVTGWAVSIASTTDHIIYRRKEHCDGEPSWQLNSNEWYSINFNSLGEHVIRDCESPHPSLMWQWSFADESGTMMTDGSPEDSLGNFSFKIYDFQVQQSIKLTNISNQFVEFQPFQGFIWNGTQATKFNRSNGDFTNGSNFFSSTHLFKYGLKPEPLESRLSDPMSGELFTSGVMSLRLLNPITFTISGTVNTLASGSGLTLQNNAGDDLAINANGPFTFDTALGVGAPYIVSVSEQPTVPNQTCSVTNGSGSVMGVDIIDVEIDCETNMYTVGGTVSGLAAGSFLELQNNMDDDLIILANGDFTFNIALDDLSEYEVTVTNEPTNPNQTCNLINASGALSGSNVDNIQIDCVTNNYDLNINVTGLVAGNFVNFSNTNGDTLTLTEEQSSGVISNMFDETTYGLFITEQPVTPSQTCVFTSTNFGTIAGEDVTVNVECSTNQYFIGGMTSGLQSGNPVTVSLGAENLAVDNSTFIFVNPLDDLSTYTIAIENEPNSPSQSCSLNNPSGTINGNDIDDLEVDCQTRSFSIGGILNGLHQGGSVTLQNNNIDNLTLNNNGVFAFVSPLLDLTDYNVTISSQPNNPIQNCIVSSGASSLAGEDITNIVIDCLFGDDLLFHNGFE